MATAASSSAPAPASVPVSASASVSAMSSSSTSTSDLLRAHLAPRAESCRGSSGSHADGEVFSVDPAELQPRRRRAAPTAAPRRTEPGSSLPSTADLLKNHLLLRVAAGVPSPASTSFVHEADVYNIHPARLTLEFPPHSSSGPQQPAWYFFSPVHSKEPKEKTEKRQRRKRKVENSDGWWHSDHPPTPVFIYGRNNEAVNVGFQQTLAFCTTDTDGEVLRSGWLLQELTLDRDGTASTALCKVYRRHSRKRLAEQGSDGNAAAEQGSDGNAAAEQGSEGNAAVEQGIEGNAAVEQGIEGNAAAEQRSEGNAAVEQGIEGNAAAAEQGSKGKDAGEQDTLSTAKPSEEEVVEIDPETRSNAKRLKVAQGETSACSLDFDCYGQPTDLDLITKYLTPRVASKAPLPGISWIHDHADFYGQDPKTLTSTFPSLFSSDGNETWYFFNTLSDLGTKGRRKNTLNKLGTRGRRKNRTISTCDKQHWRSDTGLQKVCKGRVQVGHRQLFSFMEQRGKERTTWRMVELSLHQGQGVAKEGSASEVVISKLYRPNKSQNSGMEGAWPANNLCSRCGHEVLMAEADAKETMERAYGEDSEEWADQPSTQETAAKKDHPRPLMAEKAQKTAEPRRRIFEVEEEEDEPQPKIAEAPSPMPKKPIFTRFLSFFGGK